MIQLPERFIEHTRRNMGQAEADALCAALETPASTAIRLNRAKVTSEAEAERLLSRFGAVERVGWSEAGYHLVERPSFTLDTAFHAGAYYVQEAASQFVGQLTGDIRGARLLDLCAAPGGKTTLYATLAGSEGLVVANEIDRRRAQVLADNARKWGTGNIAVTVADPSAFAATEAWFDVVAVDAPCSGEGMFRRENAAREEWSEANVRLCAARQDTILAEAWRALRPGGRLIYSTCTFNREEDEGTLERFLTTYGADVEAVESVAVDPAWGIVCGEVGPFQTFHFYPHRSRGEGFFAAVAAKCGSGEAARLPKPKRQMLTAVDKATAAELCRWLRAALPHRYAAVADTLYAWPEAHFETMRNISGLLPVIYSGTAMGQIFKGRLKPDAALAFAAALDRSALPTTALDEATALDFLRRQDIAAEGLQEGMNLLTAEGYALGFAKRIGNRVNNLYPNSLRITNR